MKSPTVKHVEALHNLLNLLENDPLLKEIETYDVQESITDLMLNIINDNDIDYDF